MKRYNSKILKTVSVIYLGFPIFYLAAAAVIFDIPVQFCVQILLSPLFYFVSAVTVVTGYGLWEGKRWAWHLFVVSNILLGYMNALFVNQHSYSHHKLLAYLSSVGFMILILYQVSKEIRVPYFFPKIRWWESDPRYRLSAPVQLSRGAGNELAGEILDISMGGCFIKLRSELKEDEHINLSFSFYGYSIDCEGTVVWRTHSTVTHPKGVGIKFTAVSKEEKRKLKLVIKRLRKIAVLYRKFRYLLSQEEFKRRLTEIETIAPPKKPSLRKVV